MNGDAFCVLLACAAFVVGLGFGLFIGEHRPRPLPKGKPVSDARLRKLWVVDDTERERQHPTISPYGKRSL